MSKPFSDFPLPQGLCSKFRCHSMVWKIISELASPSVPSLFTLLGVSSSCLQMWIDCLLGAWAVLSAVLSSSVLNMCLLEPTRKSFSLPSQI